MSRLVPPSPLDLIVRTRVSVVTAMSSAAGTLVAVGVAPLPAAAIAVAATVGGVGVGCRLTLPHVAPRIVISVLITILVLVVNVVGLGYPAPDCLAVVLTAAWCAAELARWLTGWIFCPIADAA
jgi:hypothetical protein